MAEESAYFDTSVVKRYVEEARSPQARGFMRRYRLLSSVIAPVETVSAVCRRHRAGELSLTDFDAILARLRTDQAHWELVELSPSYGAEPNNYFNRPR
jgi:predicted nucleic acid-binding protein